MTEEPTNSPLHCNPPSHTGLWILNWRDGSGCTSKGAYVNRAFNCENACSASGVRSNWILLDASFVNGAATSLKISYEVPFQSIKIGKTQKLLQLFTVTELWLIQYSFYLHRICLHLPTVDDKTQEADWGGMEFLSSPLSRSFATPDANMFIERLGKDQYII